jgi:hypothetical protein
MEANMDGSHFGSPGLHATIPWWRRRIDGGSSLLLIALIAAVTFAAIVALDAAGIRLPAPAGSAPVMTAGQD